MAMTRKQKIFVFAPLAVIGFAAFIALGASIVQHLWNWLLPPLFGFKMITFWQTLGILLLSRILFGSWGGNGGQRRSRRRDKWEKMTPEERERLRESWGGSCGGFAGTTALGGCSLTCLRCFGEPSRRWSNVRPILPVADCEVESAFRWQCGCL